MRLIDADVLQAHLNEWSRKLHAGVYRNDAIIMDVLTSLYEYIADMPDIDAVPVRLRVEKVDIVESNGWYRKRFYCPCGQLIRTEAWDEKRCFGEGTILKENVMPRFCPTCGVKMDLKEE